nr:EAL domain-containing protein [Kineococcus vitellinus]
MASLAVAASEDLGPEQLLKRLVDVAAEHLASDGVGVMVNEAAVVDGWSAGDGELMRFVHSSHPGIDGAEQLQELTQEGPCHDALLFQVEVVVDDLHDPVQTAWPDYVQRVLQAGFRSVIAVPLVSRGRVWGTLDLYRRTPGTWRPQELQWVRLLAHVAVSYVVMAVDRDAARRAQAELAHRSTHDALTGLPNRVLLFDRLEHALSAARRHRRTVAVFFIDLDRFKAVNDTFGHATGDALLATAATRLHATLRAEDTLARLAGDEFVLVCEDLPQADPAELSGHLEAVLARLRRALAEPVRIGELDLVTSASIGLALSDEQCSADDLLADADAAMYRAKQHRTLTTDLTTGPPATVTLSAADGAADAVLDLRGGTHPGADAATPRPPAVRLPPPPPTGTTAGTGTSGSEDGAPPLAGSARPLARQLQRQLAGALPHHQLRVHYQPITDPAGRVHAVEALLRWQHPEHGLLPAARFIDLAAGNGVIVGIGHWVVEQACAQMARWVRELGEGAPQTVYVNLTARELADPALTATLAGAVREHGLHPGRLGLEVLESSFIDSHVLPALHEQQQRGHPLSIDDFGTGYSSLSRLVELPVTMAKIDKSFIAGIGHDARRAALVDAVVTVATGLDLQVIAEGVETAAQAQRVTEAGCHYLQGFHCGHPQSGEALSAAWAARAAPIA